VSNTFNIVDLSPSFESEGSESRSTPLQEGKDNEDIPNGSPQTIVEEHDSRCTIQPCAKQDNNVNKGPITRVRMQRLQHEVNSRYEHASTKNYLLYASTMNYLLLNSVALLVLRFEEYAIYG
jgi:hypothetical protein